MTADDPIRRSFAIVDQTLRATFPDSYWKRHTGRLPVDLHFCACASVFPLPVANALVSAPYRRDVERD